jgi:hypothetical protein
MNDTLIDLLVICSQARVGKAMQGKLDKPIGKVTFSILGFKENTTVIPSMDKFGTRIFKSSV